MVDVRTATGQTVISCMVNIHDLLAFPAAHTSPNQHFNLKKTLAGVRKCFKICLEGDSLTLPLVPTESGLSDHVPAPLRINLRDISFPKCHPLAQWQLGLKHLPECPYCRFNILSVFLCLYGNFSLRVVASSLKLDVF